MKKVFKKITIVNDIMKEIKQEKFSIQEAIINLKNISEKTQRKFVESIDMALKLNIDSKKDANVRGSFVLPYSVKRNVKICVFAEKEKQKGISVHLMGEEELIEKIKDKGVDFDICLATPLMMKKISTNKTITSLLGQKGLMPNMKLGTITEDISDIVEKINNGMLFYKSDKEGYLQVNLGKTSQSVEELTSNVSAFIENIEKQKTNQKMNFIQQMYLSTTMGPGLKLKLSE